jgi:hypothetical protein
MRRNALRYVVDALLFVDLCAISVVGILLGFVIPKEPGHDKFFLGLHRHQWGDIHLYLSLAMLVLLAIHLWLNWRWVVQISQRLFAQRWKVALLILSGGWIIVLLLAWVLARL